MTWLGAAVGVVVALLGLAGAWVTARRGATASPYEAIAQRVVQLEGSDRTKHEKIQELEKARDDDRRLIRIIIADREALVTYVGSIRTWFISGAKPPPPPVPINLRDVLPWSWEYSPPDDGNPAEGGVGEASVDARR